MIKVAYIDEDAGWQSIAHAALSDKYDIYIPEVIHKNVTDICGEVCNCNVALIEYGLNESGHVAYTGDDVVREIHKHNRHFPVIIITSYKDNVIQKCTEVQTIIGKEMLNSDEELKKLCHMIDSAATIYEKKKAESENVICILQEKIAAGEKLSYKEEADMYDAELYLSELDLDSSAREILINTRTLKDIDEMLSLARTIVEKHKN